MNNLSTDLYSKINFAAFFILCLIALDFFSPRSKEYLVIAHYENETEKIYSEDEKISTNGLIKKQLILREYTPILRQTVNKYAYKDGKISEFGFISIFYVPGMVFMLLLLGGSVFGVFVKKIRLQERRAAYYSLFCCFFIFLFYLVGLKGI
jgi:hypothetical protein